MTYVQYTNPRGKGFQVSQLLYDTRYRSMTIQIVALILILLAFGWLINNTVVNLANLGKEIQFKFLGEPAGYDINQRLWNIIPKIAILRAGFIGLLNTLLLAFLGCVQQQYWVFSSVFCACRKTGWLRGL